MSVITSRPINLSQLSAELGADVGLWMDDRGDEREVFSNAVDDVDLATAIDSHEPMSAVGRFEALIGAVDALPDPSTDFAGFKAGFTELIATLSGIAPGQEDVAVGAASRLPGWGRDAR